MTPNPDQRIKLTQPSLSVRIIQATRRYFVAGLITLFPATVTILLLLKIFQFSDGLLGRHLAVHVPGLGLVLTVLIILLVGYLSTHFFGRVVFPTVENSFSRLPLVRQIYPAIKQLTQFLFGGEDHPSAFKRVVLVEFPRTVCYAIGFFLHETKTSVTGTEENLLTILVPTPPSPFTGNLILLPEEEVTPLTMSVEEALKLIVSGGVVSSALQTSS